MNPGETWQVVVHNDDHNVFAVVHHLLRKVCGASDAVAREKTTEIHQGGRAVVGEYESRDEAETIALDLIRFGLHTTFGEA
ncbi:ATP-dependent Clp protease adaptor ClpS [Lentzea sp. BCCO 10_0798]|uniref:ATP-dependent Clp protease adaptor ClpS n=1 Tax=Lentzea kristufekii TaxID=3095430 RepID=A0ABU4TLE8_9PSEU|nr:ATP-dependent Clp protease adaptor ClpS [Lentzea sp. BCCO 10_0798]MDX8049035.1 ATP-dependent Clp protease adaptor ClpS [Lentzea sp. BCCO 10_0798]